MGIQFFDEIEPTSGDLPFAKEYLQDNPKENGKEFLVREVRLARSNKGYMLYTDFFIGWLFKRSSTAILLVEALETYVKESYGYAIVIVLDRNIDSKTRIGVNSEVPTMWYGNGKKFSVTSDIPSFDVATGNPFLVPRAPLTPITGVLTEHSSQTPNSAKKTGKAI